MASDFRNRVRASAEAHREKEEQRRVDEGGALVDRVEDLVEHNDERVEALKTLVNLKTTDDKYKIAIILLSDSATALDDATRMLGGSTNTNGHADDNSAPRGRTAAEIGTQKFGPAVIKHTPVGGRERILLPLVDETGKVLPGQPLNYDTALNDSQPLYYDTDGTLIGYMKSNDTAKTKANTEDLDINVYTKVRFTDVYLKTIKLSEAMDTTKYEIKPDKKSKVGLKAYPLDNADHG